MLTEVDVLLTQKARCLRTDKVCNRALKTSYIEAFLDAFENGECKVNQRKINKETEHLEFTHSAFDEMFANRFEEFHEGYDPFNLNNNNNNDNVEATAVSVIGEPSTFTQRCFGKWKMVKGENLQEYYQSMGVNRMMARTGNDYLYLERKVYQRNPPVGGKVEIRCWNK